MDGTATPIAPTQEEAVVAGAAGAAAGEIVDPAAEASTAGAEVVAEAATAV